MAEFGELLVEPAAVTALIDVVIARREAAGIAGVSVSARVEDGRHIRIAPAGGADLSLVVFGQQLTIETFDTTLTGTAFLMARTMGILRTVQHTVQGGVTFYGIQGLGGGNNAEDPRTGRPRASRSLVFPVRKVPA